MDSHNTDHKNEQITPSTTTPEDVHFEYFNLSPQLLNALRNVGFLKPTLIQRESMASILSGQDVFVQAETGSGKTGAFCIPLIQRILEKRTDIIKNSEQLFVKDVCAPLYFILAPTRELAQQINRFILDLVGHLNINSACIIGGESIVEQKELTAKGIHFLVGTPGRIIDLYKQKAVNFSNCQAVALDECDRLFEMGMKEDIMYILLKMPVQRQILLFSATNNLDVLTMAYKLRSQPVEIRPSKNDIMVKKINHVLMHLGEDEKWPMLVGLLRQHGEQAVMVFCNTQHATHNIEEQINRLRLNIKIKSISGRLPQEKRTKLMQGYRDRQYNVLVCTDVAARGLDIDDVTLVINFDLPQDASNYVHRVGRTGRSGKEGKAISFCSYSDCEFLDAIEEYLHEKIPTIPPIEEYLSINNVENGSPEDNPNTSLDSAKFDNEQRIDDMNESTGTKNRGSNGPRRDQDRRKSFKGRTGNGFNKSYQEQNGGGRPNQGNRDRSAHFNGRNRDQNRDGRPSPQHGGNKERNFNREQNFKEKNSAPPTPQKCRVFNAEGTSAEKFYPEVLKFFNLSDSSLIDFKVLEEGKKTFLIFGPTMKKFEFFVRPEFKALTRDYLNRIFKLGEFNLDLVVDYKEENGARSLTIDLVGADEEMIQQNEHEFIFALEHCLRRYLSSLIPQANQVRISFSCSGNVCGTEKEEKLKGLAKKMKERALQKQGSIILRPMNPTDRRIIHQFLDGDTEVKTISIGDGHYKKIKIVPLNLKADSAIVEGQDEEEDSGFNVAAPEPEDEIVDESNDINGNVANPDEDEIPSEKH